MKITGRQIITTLALLILLLVTATSWFGVFTGKVGLGKDSSWFGCYCFVGALFTGIGGLVALVIALENLWDSNPTLEFPKPRLPRAVAKERE